MGVTEQIGAEAEAAPAAWTVAMTELISDMQSARLHGFTEQELAIVKKAMLAAAEHAAQTEATQDARAFLSAMNQALSVGERPRSAAQNVELLRQILPGITTAEVTTAFATNFTPEHRAYIVSLPEQPGVDIPSREALRTAVEATAV